MAAKRYFHLATAIFPGICDDGTYTELTHYWLSSPSEQQKLLGQLMRRANFEKRTVSYSAPPGSIPC
jgi:hypothetical protein